MDNKMLFDATHPEETRVVVVRGNRVEEFDFEAENRKQLKGNIYLAKVTRVEPSLQAAFVDYGGNRHGFLAFSEIHPDYYQIPVADRQALLDEEAAAHKASAIEEDEQSEKPKRRPRRRKPAAKAANTDDTIQSEIVDEPSNNEATETLEPAEAAEVSEPVAADTPPPTDDDTEAAQSDADSETTADTSADANNETEAKADNPKADDKNDSDDDSEETNQEDSVESVGSEDALEEVPERQSRPRAKHYKIQEVIKRRQIILVQVVKEERGNKGAALTTYLSLAGRYSVLMPNTDRGGGISRKITNQSDRKNLRAIANGLDVPEGMGVILRTAGASRTKTEINRDFEYLMRLWGNVRDLTLQSSAPALVYEEGSLLKRSIRDLYNKDINQVLVSGENGYREAKDFMRMLMPSHAKNVQPYKDRLPIFAKYGVEAQLDAMFSPKVTLKSGGYLVIDQTEALVSIDVNSGRSTRESSIEDTALSTNMETAAEVARQLRLRDLAGLIVIDFIDMDDKRNIRAVERRLKECLRDDRARIQVGHISHFGLLEMSRQRIRASVLESTMEPCAHCEGTGSIRAPASIALYVLRAIEEYLNKGSKYDVIVRAKSAVALYVLNHKRAHLTDLEERFGLSIRIDADETITGEYCQIVRGEKAEAAKMPTMVTPETIDIDVELARDAELDAAAEAAEQEQIASDTGDDDEKPNPKKRRRRRRRGGRGEGEAEATASENADEEGADATINAETSEDGEAAPKKKRRRRGRRGGRKEQERNAQATPGEEAGEPVESSPDETAPKAKDVTSEAVIEAETPTQTVETVSSEEEPKAEAPKKKPARRAPRKTATKKADAEGKVEETPIEKAEAATPTPVEAPNENADDKPEEEKEKSSKGGWWQRRSFF
ncbi:MAG: Rne/Rng family ribonuclease [Hyphomicrobiales bacterium]